MRTSLLLIILALFLSASAFADMETTTVLPVGVRSPLFQFGVMNGLSERFNSDGMVEGVTDRYHLQLMGPVLSKLDSRLKQLIDTLNASSNQMLGNQLSVGTLDFASQPVVSYFAPEFAYGLTENLSVGFGIPIIHYHNDMSIIAGGVNNAAALHATVGSLSPEADQAFDTLANLNIVSTVQQSLSSKGYQPIRTVDTTNVGDLILSGVWRYHMDRRWRLALRPFIQVPTGTKPDPDDLEAMPTGGQPAVGFYSIHDYYASSRLILTSSLGYQANIADTVDARVPTSSDDYLPSPDRKETVHRQTGNTTFLEGGAKYRVSYPVELAAYYDVTVKDPDWYSGDRDGYDYSLLSRDTYGLVHMLKTSVMFSTVDWFKDKTFAIPFQAIFAYGATVYAVNSPNTGIYQFYLRMFF